MRLGNSPKCWVLPPLSRRDNHSVGAGRQLSSLTSPLLERWRASCLDSTTQQQPITRRGLITPNVQVRGGGSWWRWHSPGHHKQSLLNSPGHLNLPSLIHLSSKRVLTAWSAQVGLIVVLILSSQGDLWPLEDVISQLLSIISRLAGTLTLPKP